MAIGRIKKLVIQKGYGFIRPEGGGEDIFFHHSVVQGCRLEELSRGDEVVFELASADEGKGARASSVQASS